MASYNNEPFGYWLEVMDIIDTKSCDVLKREMSKVMDEMDEQNYKTDLYALTKFFSVVQESLDKIQTEYALLLKKKNV